ncbi:MAG: hypothetical protein LBL24_07470, partial [Bacteroidales bacterium]|nr:hypothetical protein [Bacteroidales bacterium]
MSSTSSNWVLNLIDNITAPLRNITGASRQANETLDDIPETLEEINEEGGKVPGTFERIGAKLFIFNQAAEAIGRLNGELQNAIEPGVAFQASLAELQSISNVTGEQLAEIADRARATGKVFG